MAQENHTLNRSLAFIDKYFAYAIIFSITCISFFGYLLFVGPKYQKINSEGVLEVHSRKEELDAKQQELENIKALVAQYQALNTSELQKIQAALPVSPRVPDLFAQFETLAQKSQVGLASVSINEGSSFPSFNASETPTPVISSELQNVGILDITLKVGALDTYDKLKVFLDGLESNIRVFDLTSLQYIGEDRHEAYSLNIKAYYLKSDQL